MKKIYSEPHFKGRQKATTAKYVEDTVNINKEEIDYTLSL